MEAEINIAAVPLLDLNAQYEGIRQEVKEAIHDVLESQHFIMGDKVQTFEKKIASYCGSAHAVGCASGSDALLLALMALDIGPGDAVITTPFTFFATAGAVARLGATPVFLDIDPVSYNIDPQQIETFMKGNHPLNKKLDIYLEDVKAIIPVHLYGQMADMSSIIEVAEKYDLKVIEDAAQSIGSEFEGKRAGSIGDFGCFSFFPSKNLGGYGDGGLVTTDDPGMAEKLSVLRLHGANPKYHHSLVGINSRLDAIQAAVLSVKLKYLDVWSQCRRQKALRYNELFYQLNIAADDVPPDTVPVNRILPPRETTGAPKKNGRHIYHQYVIRTGSRDQIMAAFDKHDIGYSVYYPVPLHEQECFAYLGYEPADCPESQRASRSTLALPIYPELSDAQQEYIVETIREAIEF